MMSKTLNLILIPLLLHQILAIGSREYAELQAMGGSCYPQDTCCTLQTSKDDHLWGSRTCECGQHCMRHNTCCTDSPFTGQTSAPEFHLAETCQKVATTTNYVQMVSTCSQKTQLYQECVQSKFDVRDPLSSLPVTSLKSGTTYKNFFCASCNRDDDTVVFWNIELLKKSSASTTLKDDLEFDARSRSWGVLEGDPGYEGEFRKVTLKFVLPPQLKKIVKKCLPGLVSDCDPKHSHALLRQKCRSYYSPIKLRLGDRLAKYRNIHCALCYNATVATHEDRCQLWATGSEKRRPIMSFALLLDVNRRDGDLVGQVSRCQGRQVYDPFFKKCRSLVCIKPNYIIKNGSCVKPDD